MGAGARLGGVVPKGICTQKERREERGSGSHSTTSALN